MSPLQGSKNGWGPVREPRVPLEDSLHPGLFSAAPFGAEDGGVLRPDATLMDVTGTVTLNGKPAAGLQVLFNEIPDPNMPPPRQPTVANARVTLDGAFSAYQPRGLSGLKPGKYAVTFAPAAPLIDDGKKRDNVVPEKYRAINTTPYRIEVKPDVRNRFEFKLKD